MQSWLYCLTCISIIVGCAAQFYGYNQNWLRFRHANHYKRLGLFGNQKHFVAIENPPNYFNPFLKGEIELQQVCPKLSVCPEMLPREKTQSFICANDKECPAYYKCCPERCFEHKVCRPAAWRFEKRKSPTIQPTPVPDIVTKTSLLYNTQYQCPRSSSCLKALNIKDTLIFKCTADQQCPRFHKCCPNSCFLHNVCRPAESKMKTITTKPTINFEDDKDINSDPKSNSTEDDIGIDEEETATDEDDGGNSVRNQSDETTDETDAEVDDDTDDNNSVNTDDVTEDTSFDEASTTPNPEEDSSENTDESNDSNSNGASETTTEKSDEDASEKHDADDEDYVFEDYDSNEYDSDNEDEKSDDQR